MLKTQRVNAVFLDKEIGREWHLLGERRYIAVTGKCESLPLLWTPGHTESSCNESRSAGDFGTDSHHVSRLQKNKILMKTTIKIIKKLNAALLLIIIYLLPR